MGVKERQKKRFHDQTVARAEADRARGIPLVAPGGTPEVTAPPNNDPNAPPPDAIMEAASAAAAQTPEGRATMLRTEIARREAAVEKQAAVASLKEKIALREAQLFEGQILTTPLPTGLQRIDKAGDLITVSSPSGNLPSYQKQLPSLDHLPPEHEDRINHDRGQAGVELRKGIPFAGRVKMAIELGTPGVENQVIREVVSDLTADIPAGMPYMRLDPILGTVEFLQKVTAKDIEDGYEEDGAEGKFRWVSAESAGITGNSIGAVFDLAELGSITGGIAGAVATRNLTFFKNAGEMVRGASALSRTQRAGRGAAGLGGEAGLGLVGREVGNLISLAISKAQGREIDPQEVFNMFQSDLALEAGAAILGRGASKAFDTLRAATSVAGASLSGKHIIVDDAQAAREATAATRQASEDTAALNKQLEQQGRTEKITVTEAEGETILNDELVTEGPSGQKQRRASEADRLASQGESAKIAERDRGLATETSHRILAQSLGSDVADNFSVKTANEVIAATERMPLRPVPDDPSRGMIAPSNMEYNPAHNQNGLIFQVMPDNTLKIVGTELPEGLRGIGLGTDMYRSYLALGVKEGRTPTSGHQVSDDAMAVWGRLKNEGWDVVKADNVKKIHGKWSVVDKNGLATMDPVWRLRTESPFTKDIVASIDEITRTSAGKIAKGDNFERFRVLAEPTELAAVKTEVAQNTLLRADMAEALLRNYEKHVLYTGTDGAEHLSSKALGEWMDDSARVLGAVFTPSERLAIRNSTNSGLTFRNIVEDMVENKAALNTAYGTVLSPSTTKGFRDNAAMLKQIRALKTAGAKKRVFNIMREQAPEQFEAMKGMLQNEVRDAAYKPVAGGTVSRTGQHRLGKYINDNQEMLTEVLGAEYVANLRMYNRSVARQTIKQGIAGVKRVINPPMLMAARTVMGVMNKWQRRVTAARRFQMQKWYGRSLDIIAEPEKLKQYISLQELQLRLGPNHKAVIAGAVRLGLVDDEDDWEAFNNFARTWVNQVHDDYLAGFGDPSNQTAKARKDAEDAKARADIQERLSRGNTARPQSFELPQ